MTIFALWVAIFALTSVVGLMLNPYEPPLAPRSPAAADFWYGWGWRSGFMWGLGIAIVVVMLATLVFLYAGD
jgi:hypothetical protein